MDGWVGRPLDGGEGGNADGTTDGLTNMSTYCT